MRRELFHIFTVVVLLGALMASVDGLNEEERGMTTYIYGTVVDSETGDPLEGIDVWIRNDTIPRNFHTNTDENGYYEVQVGGNGNFFVEAYSPLHPWTSKRIEIGFFEWKEVNITLEEYDHDLYVAVSSNSDHDGIEGAKVSILDQNWTMVLDNKYTNESGTASFDIMPGNYTYTIEAENYQTETGEFEIKEYEAKHLYIEMDLHRADEDSNNTLVEREFSVPAKSIVAYSFNSSFDTRAWAYYNSDVSVLFMEMTDVMFDYYVAKTKGENLSNYEDPWIEFDVKLGPSFGGGGDVSVWSETYFLVFVNEEEKDATCDLLVKYDYGDLEEVGFQEIPLDARIDGGGTSEDEEMEIPWFVIIAIVISSLLLLILFSLMKRERTDQ